jgi:hypothetical protein
MEDHGSIPATEIRRGLEPLARTDPKSDSTEVKTNENCIGRLGRSQKVVPTFLF